MHERCPVAPLSRAKRHRVYVGVGLFEHRDLYIDQTAYFVPAVLKIPQKQRHVIVAVLLRVAARARTEQHDTLDAITIHLSERSAVLDQDWIGRRHVATIAQLAGGRVGRFKPRSDALPARFRSHPQHIHHGIDTRRLALAPQRRLDRAPRKDPPVICPVRDLDAFPVGRKQHRVIADDAPAA